MDTETPAATPPFPVTAEAMAVLETLWAQGHGAYLVGGGVRDALLGLPVRDWDVATDARPERILRIFPGSSYENRFGTVLAHGLEITTFRRDHRYADHRRPDSVSFSDDIFEDLARRDLTINAIAWGRRGPGTEARLLDPADGRGDLEARVVRAVGDPGRRFEEDALRLLRAVRIAARLDFTIDPMTRRAMQEHAADIEWVSEERIGGELRRMFDEAEPSRAVRFMRDTGLLATLLPEIETLPADALHCTLLTLDGVAAEARGDVRLGLAALFSRVDADVARAALERLRLPGRLVHEVVALVAAAATNGTREWSDAEVRRYMARIEPELLDDLLALRAARDPDAAAAEAQLRARIETQRREGVPLRLADLAIDGHDLREALGMPEGPAVGLILDRLLDDVIEDPTRNSRATLLTRAGLILDRRMQAVERPGAPPLGPPGME